MQPVLSCAANNGDHAIAGNAESAARSREIKRAVGLHLGNERRMRDEKAYMKPEMPRGANRNSHDLGAGDEIAPPAKEAARAECN